MSDQTHDPLKPMPEQLKYANLLFLGAWGGIAIMTLTYIIYLTGILPAHAPIDLIIQNWGHGVHEFLEVTDSPHGWGWLGLLGCGDFINFTGMVLLAVMTILCYLFLLQGYSKRKDWSYFFIALAEIIVLTTAASGILGSGGH